MHWLVIWLNNISIGKTDEQTKGWISTTIMSNALSLHNTQTSTKALHILLVYPFEGEFKTISRSDDSPQKFSALLQCRDFWHQRKGWVLPERQLTWAKPHKPYRHRGQLSQISPASSTEAGYLCLSHWNCQSHCPVHSPCFWALGGFPKQNEELEISLNFRTVGVCLLCQLVMCEKPTILSQKLWHMSMVQLHFETVIWWCHAIALKYGEWLLLLNILSI